MCASPCTNPSSHACSKCSQPKMSQQQGRMDAHSFECRAVYLPAWNGDYFWWICSNSFSHSERRNFHKKKKIWQKFLIFIFIHSSATICIGNTGFKMPSLWNKVTVYTNTERPVRTLAASAVLVMRSSCLLQ